MSGQGSGYEPSNELIEAVTEAGGLINVATRIALRAAVAFRTVDGHPELVPWAEHQRVVGERDERRRLMGAYLVPLEAGTLLSDNVRPCTCTLVKDQTALEPAEWEQDPECDQHGDIRYFKAERDRLHAEVGALVTAARAVLEADDEESLMVSEWDARKQALRAALVPFTEHQEESGGPRP